MSSVPPNTGSAPPPNTNTAPPQESAEQRKQRQANASVVNRFAERYHMVVEKVLPVLRATAFKQSASGGRDPVEVSDDQMYALLVVAEQYNLNPFTKEIYAYPDKQKGIVPVVSVDGWVRIVQEHKYFAGFEIRFGAIGKAPNGKMCFESIGFKFLRNDAKTTDFFDEYLDECYRPPYQGQGYTTDGPWQSHPKRMLRHKAFIQSARMTFGFAGIYDDDEAQRILEGQYSETTPADRPATRTEAAKQALQPRAIEHNPAPVANFTAPAAGDPVRREQVADNLERQVNRALDRGEAGIARREQSQPAGEWDMPDGFTDKAADAAQSGAGAGAVTGAAATGSQEVATAAQEQKPASPTQEQAKPAATPAVAAQKVAPKAHVPPSQDEVRKLLVAGTRVFPNDEDIKAYLSLAQTRSEARLRIDDVIDDGITHDIEISPDVEKYMRELTARLPKVHP